ncbi:MAG TPA: tyrosine-type recombinase/integrase, partial [Mycobacteriales bacterium]|nr:tyrosine-type recombinase/integrase [Mycobacteriales bacterium]
MRWTAYFESLDGRIRSAGTYATKEAADLAWLEREAAIGRGLVDTAAKSKMLFADFAENIFLPSHVVSPARMRELGYCIRGRLNPVFGHLQLREITRQRVRAWVAEVAPHYKPATVRSWKVNLTTILNVAVSLDYLAANPALGVKTPKEPPYRLEVLDHSEYTRIRDALPGPISRIIVDVAIETGLRWGELAELRVKDLRVHRGRQYLRVCRAVVDAGTALTGGDRYAVADMTKGGSDRNVSLRDEIADALTAHIEALGLDDDELLFNYAMLMTEVHALKAARRTEVLATPIPDDLGRTEPNERGRTYRHGTLNAYIRAKCRCECCRHRMAQRSATRHPPPGRRGLRTSDPMGHIPRDTFRTQIWIETLDLLGCPADDRPTFHKLRHAHASWLLAGGA